MYSTPQTKKTYDYSDNSSNSNRAHHSKNIMSASNNQSTASPYQATTIPSSLQQSLMREQLSGDFSINQQNPSINQFNNQQQSSTSLKNSLTQTQNQQNMYSKNQSFQPSAPPVISNNIRGSHTNKVASLDTQASNGQGLFPNSSSILSSKITSPTYQPLPNLSAVSQLSSITPNSNTKMSPIKQQSQQQYIPNQERQMSSNNNYNHQNQEGQEALQQGERNGNQNANMNTSQNIQQNTQGNKHDNSFCSTGSRRFSFFSKTSCATGVSQTFGGSLFRRANQSVPKVNITNIIKKRAYLYLDEGLANTFDELLESGYNIVLNKKNERDELRQMEEAFKMELDSVQKEIAPLYQQLNKTQTQLQYYNELYLKQIAEHEAMEKEIQMLKEIIAHRQHDIQLEEQSYSEQIKQSEIENNNIRTEILLNKTTHKQERDSIEKSLKVHKQELDKITEYLSEQKSQSEDKKQDQASRLRKMENKSKMYLGILKH